MLLLLLILFNTLYIFYYYREKREKIFDIYNNIHESIYDLARHMSLLVPPVPFANGKSEISAEYILNLGENRPEVLTDVS